MRKSSIADRSNPSFLLQSGNFSIRFATRLAISGLGLILAATLFPFNFTAPQLAPIEVFAHFNASGNLIDQVGNILLFAPFGFGIGGVLLRQGRPPWQAVLLTGLASTSLSTLVELLQFFLPDRTPTVTDIMTNSLGGAMGAVIVCGTAKVAEPFPALLRRIRSDVAIKVLSAAFLGYVLFTAAIAMMLQAQTHLNNWDETFPLVLGNETTGDRPWQGQIAAVAMYDEALSPEAVEAVLSRQDSLTTAPLADYQLKAQGIYSDETGQFPDLFWSANDVHAPQAGAFANLIQPIRQSAQFTLVATAATQNLTQTGPARMISISDGTLLRNFTLGQQGNHLAIRLRTPITGENGKYPELIVPDVFLDQVPHRFVITYQKSLLTCYIDRIQRAYSINLSPDITFFRHLLPFNEWSVRLSPAELWAYQLFYYGIIFIPLGILLGIIATILGGTFADYRRLSLGGILVPASLLETIWASGAQRHFSFINLGVAIGLLSMTAFITMRYLTAKFQRNRSG